MPPLFQLLRDRAGFALFFTAMLGGGGLAMQAAQTNLVFADFEGTTYGDWKAAGSAFGSGPARGALSGQRKFSGFVAQGLVNSCNGGEKATGTLTSPDFTVSRKFITFLIGGGGWEGKTCINLLIGTNVVRTTAGPSTKSGSSPDLVPGAWDVSEFAGQRARIEIVDNSSKDDFGYIKVDEIVFTDDKASLSTPEKLAAAKEEQILKAHLPDRTGPELLYNGIVLPKEWPPNVKPKGRDVRKVPEVPYLQNRPAVVPIDVGRQLFVDDFLIENTTLKRQFHYPQRYEGNPILKAETSIELNGGRLPMAAMISDGACYDPKEHQFKLWYEAGWRDGTMLATSQDGLHFTRPNLDVEQGSSRVLPKRKRMVRHGTGIFQDLWTTNAQERFKMTIYENDSSKAWAYTSPDGIHWINRGAISECGDNTTIFYNPFRRKWVYSIRQDYFGRMRHYRECDDFVAGKLWENPQKPTSEAVNWAHADDLDLPDPDLVKLMAKLKADPNVKKTNDSGKPWDYDVTTQLYNVDAVPYESLMLGMFAIHRGPENHLCYEVLKQPKMCDLVLAYSRDGFHWDRPDRTAFLAGTRKEGDWERGYLHSGVGICTVVGDKLFFYYGGWSGQAPDPNTPWSMYAGGATGVAFLRRDGFVSLNATDDEGTVTTRPVTFKGNYMFVNVDAPKGELRVEALDESGKVIAPFTAANSVPISGDKTRQQVVWNGAADLSKLNGQKVRFRFTLRNGQLYAFWVTPDANGASFGYVAAGGPEFDGPTDTVGGK